MKLLLDQDVYLATERFLSELGHDVVPVAQLGLARADDAELLRVAQAQGYVFVTRDRDYGNLVFVQSLGARVIYLRMLPSTQMAVHEQLTRVLDSYSETELRDAFVVIGPGGYRFRRLPHSV
jgi:predicted nuclease of predicted toxin-antitoxin system